MRTHTHFYQLCMVALMLLGMAVLSIMMNPVRSASAASTGGYPWYNATYVDSNYDWGYTTCPSDDDNCKAAVIDGYGVYDPWGYNLRNCTSFVAWKLSTLGVADSALRGLGNGGDWYNNSAPGEHASAPKAGYAAVQPGTADHPYGHVAYVDAVSGSGDTTTITVEEYNYAGDGNWGTRTGTPASLGFSEYLNFGLPTATGNLWGVTTGGQAVRYAGSGQWTPQGGPVFQQIAADSNGSTVAAVANGRVYTYVGNGAWHMVSGPQLISVGVE